MSWLITGGSGQLGIALSSELKFRGIEYNSLSSKELDVTNSDHVSKVLTVLSPTVVVNCAAWTDVDGAEENPMSAKQVNVIGAENIAFNARFVGAKVIQISTDYVFSGHGNTPWRIDSQAEPLSVYGRTKAEAEKRVLMCNPENAIVVRTAWLYSPWKKNFVKTMVRLAFEENREIPVVNDQVGQPTSAVDLARILIEIGQSSYSSGIYHATNSGSATWFELATMVFKHIDADTSKLIPVMSQGFPTKAKRPLFSVLSHENNWITSLSPMRNWADALQEVMPRIIANVKEENQK